MNRAARVRKAWFLLPRVRQKFSLESARKRASVHKHVLLGTPALLRKQVRPHSRHRPAPAQNRPTLHLPLQARQGPTARPLALRENRVLFLPLLFPCSPQLVTIPLR